MMMIIWLLFAHWVADFVFQSDWMSKGKSKNNGILLTHCLTYGLVILFFIIVKNPSKLFYPMLIFSSVVAIIHFPVDYVTSRINAKFWAEKRVHLFFVSIGFDQFIHGTTLILIYRFFTF